nr:9060_t:CDS:2 [Entrophospora candida]
MHSSSDWERTLQRKLDLFEYLLPKVKSLGHRDAIASAIVFNFCALSIYMNWNIPQMGLSTAKTTSEVNNSFCVNTKSKFATQKKEN